MRRLLDMLAPEKACQEGKTGAVLGDEAVEPLGDGSDAGCALIQPQRPSLAWRDRLRPEDCLGSRIDVPVRVDKLHRLLALLTSQFGKTHRDGWVLEGDVFDAITGALLPARDPATAEIAVAIEDHHGFDWCCGHTSDLAHGGSLTHGGDS